MTTEKPERLYTIAELAQITGRQPRDFTDMWMAKKFPNSKVSPEKVLLIPEGDVKDLLPKTITQPPPDFSKLKQEAEEQATKIKADANAEAEKIKKDAEIFAQTLKDSADTYYNQKVEQGNKVYKDKLAELEIVTGEVNHWTQELERLTTAKNLIYKKYDEIRNAVVTNQVYHYNMAMKDYWGRFQLWANKLISGGR
jgi:uncharacterized protein (DUF2164 family)